MQALFGLLTTFKPVATNLSQYDLICVRSYLKTRNTVQFSYSSYFKMYTWYLPVAFWYLSRLKCYPRPSRNLHVQSQQWEHQSNVLNLFTVTNKDARTTSVMVYCCLLKNYFILDFQYLLNQEVFIRAYRH